MAAEKLLADPFWNKKMDIAAKYRDTDKDGFISQNDFKIAVDRYVSIAKASPEKVELVKNQQSLIFEQLGLTDPSVKVPYDALKKFAAKTAEHPDRRKFVAVVFDILDLDSNGEISYEEWETHHKCNGIDTAYAKTSFDAMDANKDGVVVRDEFTDYYEEFYYTTEDTMNSSQMYGPLDQ